VVRPLAPGLMVFVLKGQPYDMELVMGHGQLFGKLTVGLPENIVDQRRGTRAL